MSFGIEVVMTMEKKINISMFVNNIICIYLKCSIPTLLSWNFMVRTF